MRSQEVLFWWLNAIIYIFTHQHCNYLLCIETMNSTATFEIDYGELQFQYELGQGNFGTVYKGRYDGGDVAIKKLHLFPDERMMEYIVREMRNISECRHPNIVTLYGLCVGIKGAFIITEYVSGGDLRKQLDSAFIRFNMKLKVGVARALVSFCGLFLSSARELFVAMRESRCFNRENTPPDPHVAPNRRRNGTPSRTG